MDCFDCGIWYNNSTSYCMNGAVLSMTYIHTLNCNEKSDQLSYLTALLFLVQLFPNITLTLMSILPNVNTKHTSNTTTEKRKIPLSLLANKQI